MVGRAVGILDGDARGVGDGGGELEGWEQDYGSDGGGGGEGGGVGGCGGVFARVFCGDDDCVAVVRWWGVCRGGRCGGDEFDHFLAFGVPFFDQVEVVFEGNFFVGVFDGGLRWLGDLGTVFLLLDEVFVEPFCEFFDGS